MKNYFPILLLIFINTISVFSQGIIDDKLEVKGESNKAKLVIEPNNEEVTVDITARKNNTDADQPGRDIRWFTKQNQEFSMSLTSKGMLGIGVLSPNEYLSVSKTFSVMGSTDKAKLIFEPNDNNQTIDITARKNNLTANQPGRGMRWFTKDNQALSMFLTSQGMLGIGVASPNEYLSVSKTFSVLGSAGKAKFVVEPNDNDQSIDITARKNNLNADQPGRDIRWFTRQNQELSMILTYEGNLGVGIDDPQNKLSVNGTIWAKEVKVTLEDAADWVFDDDYELKTLDEVENFIKDNKHLPDVPSADEFREEDMNLAKMNNKLLQKIEELTLYLIEQNKKVEEQGKKLEDQQKAIEILKSKVQ